MVVSIIVGVVIYYIGELIDINMYIKALGQVLLGVSLYILVAYICKLDALKYTKNIILQRLRK